MQDKSPWLFLMQLVLTAGAMFLMIYLVITVSITLHDWRDEFRCHYVEETWTPQLSDFAMVPIWLTLEVICLALLIIWALIVLWVLKSYATAFRDWWHEGAKSRR